MFKSESGAEKSHARRPDRGGRSTVFGTRGAVACEHPSAAVAGLRVLDEGGTAADASVAMAAAMAVVGPMATGMGGDAFLLFYDAATRKITAFDGREAAPKGAMPGMFLDSSGEPLSYRDAVLSGRSTGVPGAIAMLLGGLTYVIGMTVVTMVCNVPLNNALAAVDASSSEGASLWARYLKDWTLWNHVRTVTSTAACAFFILAIAAHTPASL